MVDHQFCIFIQYVWVHVPFLLDTILCPSVPVLQRNCRGSRNGTLFWLLNGSYGIQSRTTLQKDTLRCSTFISVIHARQLVRCVICRHNRWSSFRVPLNAQITFLHGSHHASKAHYSMHRTYTIVTFVFRIHGSQTLMPQQIRPKVITVHVDQTPRVGNSQNTDRNGAPRESV